jgi:hypothetical protein
VAGAEEFLECPGKHSLYFSRAKPPKNRAVRRCNVVPHGRERKRSIALG